MSELSAQQLHDLMSPLWERCPELSPKGLMFDYISQSNEYSHPNVPVLYPMLHGRWIESPQFPEEAVAGTASATQLCESQMVRWLEKLSYVKMFGGVGGHEVEVGGIGIFDGDTLVQALASACTAVLDAKEQDPA